MTKFKPARARPPWTDRYKDNWDDAYERMMAWWEGGSLDRPVIWTNIVKPDAPPFVPSWDPGTPELRDLDEEYRFSEVKHFLESHLFLAEAVPFASTGHGSGVCLLAAMAGAKVDYAPDNGTAWIEKIDGLYERPLPEFSEDNPAYAYTIKMIHRHAQGFGCDCVLSADDIIDPMTTLSMMRGPAELCMDLVENPEMVKQWCKRLGEFYLEMAKGFRAARAVYNRREENNWTGVFAPGDMEAIQCDFSTMLSPEMFNEFVMPEVEREADFFDYSLWHLDGIDEIRHLDAICSVKKIRGVQWVDSRFTNQMAYLDLFKRIRGKGKSLVIACQTPDEAIEVTKELGKDGLAMKIWDIKSEKDMDLALKRFKAL